MLALAPPAAPAQSELPAGLGESPKQRCHGLKWRLAERREQSHSSVESRWAEGCIEHGPCYSFRTYISTFKTCSSHS